jgi:PhnB protein
VTKVNIYLNFPGNAEEAFTFYRSVFRSEYQSLLRFKDMLSEGATVPEADENKIMHVALPIGEDVLMASDALPGMGFSVRFGNNAYISVHPDSKEEADRLFAALSEGGTVEMPIADQVWGDYFGSLLDRFGVHWMVNYSYPK